MRLLKLVLYLVILAAIGLVAFAYLGDLSPDQKEIRVPVELNAE